MKILFILASLMAVLLLAAPTEIQAQQISRSATDAANKSWRPFWTQFSSAVRNKNKAAMKRLMSSEKDFFSGGGGETRDEWLKMLDDRKIWGLGQKSVAKGVVPFNEGGKIGRITKDRHLIFRYIGGRWRFVGIMGD